MGRRPGHKPIEWTIPLVVSVCCGRVPSHPQQASPVTEGAISLTSYHYNTISIFSERASRRGIDVLDHPTRS
jgi:hypothetical protein